MYMNAAIDVVKEYTPTVLKVAKRDATGIRVFDVLLLFLIQM